MLEKKLERAKNKRQILIRRIIFYMIALLISIIVIAASVIGSNTYLHKSYSASNMDAYFLFFILTMISTIFALCSLIFCLLNKKELSCLESEIDNILFKLSLPTDFCYDVILRTNTLNDIHLKYNVKKLCIRYVESTDSIEYRYKLGKKKYRGSVTINFAQYLFDCKFLNDVEI